MGTETLQDGWWHVDRPFDWRLARDDVFAVEMIRCVRAINRLRRESQRGSVVERRLRRPDGPETQSDDHGPLWVNLPKWSLMVFELT